MGVLIIIALTVLIVLISQWYIRRNRFVKCLKHIPGPPPLPIIGNALDLASSKALLPKFMEWNKKYGGIVKLHIGQTPNLLVVNDYKWIEFFLSSTKVLDKAQEYKFFKDWLGSGLFTSDGDAKWRKHRKIITPTFHFQILEQFIETFQSNTTILIEKLRSEVGKPSVDIYPPIHLCTLDIICETAMGTPIHAQDHADSPYVNCAKEMAQVIVDRAFNPFLQTTIPYIFTKHYRTEKRCLKILHKATNVVIQKRKQEMKDAKINNNSELESLGMKKRLTFLDLLLKDSHNMSDLEIREEVDSFMLAGHDVTTSSITLTLFCIAQHAEVQKSVVAELQDILAEDKMRDITYKDLQKMKYMDAVIKEVLRIYPPIPFYGRQIKEDIEYEGTTLPAGLGIVLLAYGIHRNPEYFPEPEKFRPERFFSENTVGRLPYSYIPFSAGPRNCIGQKFAILELKLIVANILRNFEVLPTNPQHNLDIAAEIVLKSKNGICVQLKDRIF